LILESTPDQKPTHINAIRYQKLIIFALPETEPGRHPWFTFFPYPR